MNHTLGPEPGGDLVVHATADRLDVLRSLGNEHRRVLNVTHDGTLQDRQLDRLADALGSYRPERLLFSAPAGAVSSRVLPPLLTVLRRGARQAGIELVTVPDLLAAAAAMVSTPVPAGWRSARPSTWLLRFRRWLARRRIFSPNT